MLIALVVFGVYGARMLARRSAPQPIASQSASVSSVAGAAGCASNDECTRRLGAAALCHQRDGVCALLGAKGCEVLAADGDVSNDKTIWIGTMFPVSGPLAAVYGTNNAHAVELARRDFAHAMGATASRASSGARPLGLVSCDDADDAERVAHHLVDDVRVPAVIGFRTSTEAIELASTIFLPRGVLTLAATTASPLLATIPHPSGPRLVWRTTYNTLGTVPAIATFSERVLEPQVLALPGGARPGMRVAVLRDDRGGCLAFAEALFRQLRFNGKSALDNGHDFREILSSDPGDGREDDRAVKSLLEFAPRVVVVCGDDAMARGVIEPLERKWPAAHGPRPRYVGMGVLHPAFFTFIGKSDERRRRFFGITVVSNTPANARFVMRYNEAFDDKVTRTISPNTSYDAFYLLAFASYALAANEEITGATLAAAMKRLLPPGKPVEVGPTTIYDAFNALRAGGNVDVMGATGPLDFDPATGEAPVDMVVLCVAADARGQANDTVESGLVYRAAAGTLEGTMKCP